MTIETDEKCLSRKLRRMSEESYCIPKNRSIMNTEEEHGTFISIMLMARRAIAPR